MEDPQGPEELNEWQQIPPLWHQTSSVPAASGSGPPRSVVMVRDNYLHNDSSISPPRYHEGLAVPQQHNQQTQEPPQSSNSPLLSPLGSTSSEECEVGSSQAAGANGRCWRSGLELLSSGIARAAYRIRACAVGRRGFWSFVSVAGVLVASMVYLRVQRWWRTRVQKENRLMLLIREKDQKISHLLLQIAQMKEVLSERRTIPVIRLR